MNTVSKIQITTAKLLINGEFVESKTQQWQDIINPATQEVIGLVPFATPEEIQAAIASAKSAFASWRETPIQARMRIMLKLQQLIRDNAKKIAQVLTAEQGKTLADAEGDIQRGLEVVEHACSIGTLQMGEYTEGVARGVDTYTLQQPLGVCAGITPFNFPAMIPLWMFPMAIVCGNTFVLKPSEQDPLSTMMLVELAIEAGIPAGVLNVVHGGKEVVDALCTHQDIKAISFVGSVNVGQYIYKTGTDNLKRVQAFAGAKNHMVIMPDANKQQVVNALVGASVGAAGQRCMAISVAVFVGSAAEWIPEVAEAISKVAPGHYSNGKAAYGPQISPQAKARVISLIEQGKKEGATCLLDGSACQVEGYPNGNWVGPTVFSNVTTEMEIYKQEIFGPVLTTMTVDSLQDAIELVNASPYGNGTSIFTASGAAARKYQHNIEVGQVGINVPIPVPLPFFSFTGWKGSFYGDQHAYGKQAVRFYTETKTITARWFDDDIAVSGPNMSINLR